MLLTDTVQHLQLNSSSFLDYSKELLPSLCNQSNQVPFYWIYSETFWQLVKRKKNYLRQLLLILVMCFPSD
ncbi:unnamed protein product [Hermetia illucens]|uniref:Uncharacterized protein n=1 Tax=Hermetia illucens TaxID=343691 RepID=A0A7R8YZ90_HERIL|nr:unnamed protein product [Hermetia illucens]